jgi:hypothetical protein
VLALVATVLGLRRCRDTAQLAEDARFMESFEASRFWRGNLHAHTNLTDGTSYAEDVYAWYYEHGYHFVAITDHNLRVEPDLFAPLEQPGVFVILPGEEITMSAPGGVPVHVNAICHQRTIDGGDFASVEAALRWAVDEVRAQGGVALVNHPNFHWALKASDMRHARGAHLLEIWSGHPGVNNEGDLLRPSSEAIWDEALRDGAQLAGTAVDDVHHLDAGPELSGPGRAWIEVYSDALEHDALCAALAAGHFYASSGVRLRRLAVRGQEMVIELDGPGATVEFLDARGSLSKDTLREGGTARYRLRGDERWVRARISSPDGTRAWTQAYRTLVDPPPAGQ